MDDIIAVSEEIMEACSGHRKAQDGGGNRRGYTFGRIEKTAKKGKNIVCLITGGNIDVLTISEIINQGLITRGRIMCFSVELPDKPGQLVRVAQVLADHGANVIELQHNQFKAIDRYSNKVLLEVTVETNGHEHIIEILDALEDNNFSVTRVY